MKKPISRKGSSLSQLLTTIDHSLVKWVVPIGFGFALVLAVSIVIPIGVDIYQSWRQVDTDERVKAGIELIQLIATIVGGVAIFWNLVIARQQLAASQEQHITDRFSKAVEQLGHEKTSVRIGGIYALRRIAQDSPRDHWTIMEILTAFVRDRRGLGGEDSSTKPVRFDKDVQTVVSVLGRREVCLEPKDASLYLNYNDLRGLSFTDSNYNFTQFHGSDLRGVSFNRCQLRESRFWKANLAEAKFRDVDLSGADLSEADLRGADLENCKLKGANLTQANLAGVMGLTVEQVRLAHRWQDASYDSDFWILLNA
jgi:hypothetical protein